MSYGFYETRGERRIDPPEPDPAPECPICGEECETLYRGADGCILGCENCVDAIDAIDYFDNLVE